MRIKCCVALLALSVSAVVHADEIPVVAASVLTENVPAPIDKQRAEAKSKKLTMNTNSTLMMEEGVNQFIPIAINHLNRIVTPFSDPNPKTTSGATTQVHENVVYVATDKDEPVTLFITENGSEAQALSLTLVPQYIPPREVFLKMNASFAQFDGRRAKAERWETSQPYIETIRTVFRSLALGDIPQGYAMSSYPEGKSAPSCGMNGLQFDFTNAQYMMGHNIAVSVGVVKNVSERAIEIKESVCGGWEIAAVAAWPHNYLVPGQSTEIYVAEKQQRQAYQGTKRPSLLGGH